MKLENVILQEGKHVPANGNWPAKTQVPVVCGQTNFHLSSETLDLASLPSMIPVNVTAVVTRISGGKGFFVLNCVEIDVEFAPLPPEYLAAMGDKNAPQPVGSSASSPSLPSSASAPAKK